MTSETRNLIKNCDFNQVNDVMQIIIALQEEDDVSSKMPFKNGFKILRNLCAHTPSVVMSTMTRQKGSGIDRIVYDKPDAEDMSISNIEIVICLLKMYELTRDEAYKLFAFKYMKVFYSSVPTCRVYAFPEIDRNNYLRTFFNIQTESWRVFGLPKTVATDDSWLAGVYRNNEKLFWRIAVPNMVLLLLSYLDNVESKLRDGHFTDDGYAEFICRVYEKINV